MTQQQGVQPTGTGNRPNQICSGELDNPTMDRWFDTSCFVAVTETTATYGNTRRGSIRAPGGLNVDFSFVKQTRLGRATTEFRLEVLNLFNRLQLANPNTTLGNAAFGTISALQSNPACALCGTSERQMQVAVKVRF